MQGERLKKLSHAKAIDWIFCRLCGVSIAENPVLFCSQCYVLFVRSKRIYLLYCTLHYAFFMLYFLCCTFSGRT